MTSHLIRKFICFAGSVWFLPLVILCMFRSVLLGQTRFAFRDVSHFYTPLYGYIARRQQREWLPLWNPLDQTGVPIVGESTTALFYPLRWLIYSLPADADQRMNLYVLVHLVIAAMAMRWAALQLLDARDRALATSSRRRIAANGAGLLYALSGSVLFLACNPPFLVGAAWLPLAMSIVAGRSQPSLQDSMTAAAAMALMVLAGDPQSALHVMMIGAGVWAARGHFKSRDFALRLLWPPLIAACLAAPQIAGSLDWVRHSNRGADSLVTRSRAFDFAVPPWHAIELVTPMPFGELLPVHARWSQALPGDGRMWTPTVYAGALVGLAFFMGWRWRRTRTWWWVAAFGWLASMGPFGLVWALQNVGLVGVDQDSRIGGVYWWLYTFVPGYDSFRYPAKWLPVCSFGLTIVASHWIIRVSALRLRRASILFASVQLVIWSFSYVGFNPVELAINHLQYPGPDSFWGPFRADVATQTFRASLLHGGIAFAALAGLFAIGSKQLSGRGRAVVMLMFALIDLGLANHQLIPTMARTDQTKFSGLSTHTQRRPATRFLRTRAGSQWPSRWAETSDPNRLVEVEVTAMKTRWMRWHLQFGDRLFNGPTSIRSAAADEFWHRWRQQASRDSQVAGEIFWREARMMYDIGAELRVNEGAVELIDYGVTATDLDTCVLPDFSGGELRRTVFQDGHWSATWHRMGDPHWKHGGVRSVDGLCQAVELPAGNLEVRFVYWPWWQSPVLVIALISWFGWFGVAMRTAATGPPVSKPQFLKRWL